MTGLSRTIRVGPIGPGPVSSRRLPSPSASALRSKPEQKLPSAPVSTATDSAASALNRSKDSTSRAAVCGSTALRTSGRSMVTTTTDPSGSYRTVIGPPGLLRVHERIAVVGGRRVCLLDHAWAGPADEVEDRTRLVVGSRRARAAKRLQPDDRAGGLVIDVEAAGGVDQRLGCGANRLPVAGEDGACQSVRAGAIDELEGVLEFPVRIRIHRQDRAEQLLLEELEIWIGGLDDRRPHEPTHLVVALPARDDLRAFGLAREIDRGHVLRISLAVDHRAHEVAEIGNVSLRDGIDLIGHL